MALTKPYHHPNPSYRTMSPTRPRSSHSHTNTHRAIHPASPQTTSSSSHDSPTSPPESRRRRGRQARPSQLSARTRRAVHSFARNVGAPTVVEPAGFRDFRGWLARLSSRAYRPLWDELLAAVARDVSCDPAAVHALKEDIVREIIKCVVVPRPDESAKLVSTNAGRQAGRPRSGTTLMVVLEEQLARVEKRLPQLVAASAGAAADDTSASTIRRGSGGSGSGSRGSRAGDARLPLPSVSDILNGKQSEREKREALPSFQELEASLRRRGAHGGGSGR